MRGWKEFVHNTPDLGQYVEHRDMTEGAPMLAQLGTYTGLGYFVPTGFFQTLFAAMKAHDVLFDDDAVTMIRTSTGAPLPVPIAGDTENVASVLGEALSQSSVDIDSTSHAVLGAYSYKTPRFTVSLEAFDDLEASFTVVGLFKQFAADKLARGIGADLMVGNGSGKTLGLLPSLTALGLAPVIAAGSAVNDGSANTGANSLGTPDFAAAYNALDAAYLSSSKIAWLMNNKTLGNQLSLLDKEGRPLELVKYIDGYPTIYGIPVKVCPSLPSIGASNTPVILGDLSYWATRLIIDDNAGIAVYKEAPGLIENGNIGMRCFARAHGALLYNDTGSPAPFVMLANHS
jgi:HK97 family phage major capsid protein